MPADSPEQLVREAVQHHLHGRMKEALACASAALARDPRLAEAHHLVGAGLIRIGRDAEAVAAFERAVTLRPSYADAYAAMSGALRRMGQLDEASMAAQRAVAADPVNGGARANFGAILKDQGRLEEAIEQFRQALRVWPGFVEAHSNLIYTSLFADADDCRGVLKQHREWAVAHADCLAPPASFRHANDRSRDRRLRIGYVSGDFRAHPVTRFLLPLFANHDRERFEVHCYSNLPPAAADASTQRVRGYADVWHDVAGVPDAALAEMIRGDRIDVLIDLSLHMAGNRLLTFARKPAPVQVTYLGYAGTTGLAAMDYRITDASLDPVGENDECSVEKSVYVPSYWCYEAPTDAPGVAERRGPVTFGCLNNFCKVTPRTMNAWAEIMRRVDGSHLVLHAAEGSHRGRVSELFVRNGVDANRIEFVGKQPMAQYLVAHGRIDIALDPFPYNGGTTTCDAMWMGAAPVTLAGRTAVARAGVSLLSQVGLTELIAADVDGYVELAVKLAGDANRLAALRRGMRARMQRSPLMDAPAAARAFEAALREMWHSWCS